MATTTTAAKIVPGDQFTLPFSGDTYVATQVNVLSHVVNIFTTVGEMVSLFPRVRVTIT